MRVLLMHPAEDFAPGAGLAPESDVLAEDLGLGKVLSAMAGGDDYIAAAARAALLSPLLQPEEILYRQEVLADWAKLPGLARQLYALATEALGQHKKLAFWGLDRSPEGARYDSLRALDLLLGYLVRLRHLAGELAPQVASRALARLCSMLVSELDDAYLRTVAACMDELRLPRGLFISARLGTANVGTDYVLHKAPGRRLRGRLAEARGTSYSFNVPERDDRGREALAALQARGVNIAANAIAQSADHVLGFFQSLCAETAFYVGCLNLLDALTAKGEPVCTPVPESHDHPGFCTDGLYDPAFSLGLQSRAVGNEVKASGKAFLVVTGANRGGKSTFLRSVGLAYLMMQCGMFVAARSFSGGLCSGVLTHFRRREGGPGEGSPGAQEPAAGRFGQGGKLDEELARMSATLRRAPAGALLLCNEPFASTNSREGSEIGRHVLLPLVGTGARIVLVTHLYDLAESLYKRGLGEALFLRAPRQGLARPFQLVEGPPEPTAYAEEVYGRVFGRRPCRPQPPAPLDGAPGKSTS